MARAKTGAGGDETPAINLAELTKEQLLELAAEKNIGTVDEVMEKEEIIQLLIEADPSLSAPPADDDPPTIAEEDEGAGGDETPAETTVTAGDECEIGTIRVIRGVESVYVGEGKWVPTIRENIEAGKPVTVISPKRAGKSIYAKSGKLITFDENGRATVSAVDGQYLESIIIDEKPEFTIEG